MPPTKFDVPEKYRHQTGFGGYLESVIALHRPSLSVSPSLSLHHNPSLAANRVLT